MMWRSLLAAPIAMPFAGMDLSYWYNRPNPLWPPLGRSDAILASYVEQMKAANIDITLTGDMILDIWKKFVLLSGTFGTRRSASRR